MNSKSSGGIGLSGLLFIIFLVLKLTNNIDWSWIWVASPIWIPVSLIVAFYLGVFLISLFVLLVLSIFGLGPK